VSLLNGPGKYDAVTTLVREMTGAKSALVIITGGEHGNGFSVQGTGAFIVNLPTILRGVADQVEAEMQRAASGLQS
jgi:hypothetical protein